MKKLYCLLVFSIILYACGADKQAAPVPVPAPEGAVPAPESGPPPVSSARQPVLPAPDTMPPEPPTADSEGQKSGSAKASPRKPAAPSLPVNKSEMEEKSEVNAPRPTTALPRTARTGKAEFADIQALDHSIRLDIRYATTNNFTSAKIYDCPRCLLRPEAAQALQKAHRALQQQGLGLKMFDCYRPRPYQQRLWDKVPNPDYVTPPDKGSMHSRGAAVDLTIVDADGNELDMGTPYDFFGREAHYDYTRLPGKVLANRRLLRRTMEAAGFEGIRTEWWHFSFQRKNYPFSDFVWECD